MIEMIITPAEMTPGIVTIVIGETEKFVRKATYFVRRMAGITEGGEFIHEAVFVKEEKPERK